jgi:hypothetical protein
MRLKELEEDGYIECIENQRSPMIVRWTLKQKGVGQGVMMGGDSEMATFTGEGVGRITATRTNWRWVFFYRTASTGKLSFLNNAVGVFEVEVDSEGNFTETVWEWK